MMDTTMMDTIIKKKEINKIKKGAFYCSLFLNSIMNEDFIEEELNFLEESEEIIQKILSKYSSTNRLKVDTFKERRIKSLIKRCIQSEKEYLNEDPEEYYDMYCQDQNLN